MAQRASDDETIPLCPEHHTGDGVELPSVHGSPEFFAETYGSERELLEIVNRRLDQVRRWRRGRVPAPAGEPGQDF